jgi:uncharacterized protein (DUF1499 family)
MKTLATIFFAIILFAIFLLFIFGKYSQKGNAPGLVNDGLSKCSNKPNCVCSEYAGDVNHYIKPIMNPDNETLALSAVSEILQEMGGVINSKTNEYIAATFTSALFGFVDDMELRMDREQGIIHIRSASRVGYGDGGVNQKRVEAFKKLYGQKLEENK